MKHKAIVVLTIILLICATLVFLDIYFDKKAGYRKSSIEEVTKEKITITTTPPCTYGRIRIYDYDREIIFDGLGEIDIKNSGWNGREVDIVMNIEGKESLEDEN